MAQGVAVIRATLTATGSGTTDFTKTGFGTPTAAIILCGPPTAGSTTRVNAGMSIGFWDGTNQRCQYWYGVDGAATSNTTRTTSVTHVIRHYDNATQVCAYTAAAITDGIQLTMTVDNTSDTRLCTVILFTGVSALAGSITPNATQDGTQASASLGFAPKLVFMVPTHVTAAADSTDDARGGLGFADFNGNHNCVALHWDDAQTAEAASQQVSTTRAYSVIGGSAGEITTWGADTFTLTTRDAAHAGGQIVFYLALGGADLAFDPFVFDTRTTTGDTTIPLDVDADAVLLVLTTNTAVGTATDSGANGMAIGLADADGEFSHNTSVEDAADTTNCNSATQAAAAIDLDSSAAGSRTDLCDGTVALNTSDITLTYTVVDGTARKAFGIAFGPAAVASGHQRRPGLLLLGCGA
jgi:hypothetical protein